MNDVLTCGLDTGFGYLKVVADKKKIKFPSIIADTVNMEIIEHLTSPEVLKRQNPLNYIHAELEDVATGKIVEYFFGKLAVDQGLNPRYLSSKDKSTDEENRAAMFVGLALIAEKPSQDFYVMAGVPIEEFSELRETYEKNLPGTMIVRFKSGPLKGISRTITIKKAKVTPQGYGAYLDALLDDNGDIQNDFLAKGYLAVMDTGFKTTNVIALKDAKPVIRESKQLNDGMRTVFEYIRNEISSAGYQGVPLENMEEIYLTGRMEINDDKYISVEKAKEYALNSLAKTLIKKLEGILDVNAVKQIVVAGGGGVALFDLFPYKHKRLVDEPQFANASGYAKGAKRMLLAQNNVKAS